MPATSGQEARIAVPASFEVEFGLARPQIG
jgi:hypothetical protein